MSTFQNYKEKKQAFLDLVEVDSGNEAEARRLIQAAREMVLAEMQHKAAKEYDRGPSFGLGLEWIDWLLGGGIHGRKNK